MSWNLCPLYMDILFCDPRLPMHVQVFDLRIGWQEENPWVMQDDKYCMCFGFNNYNIVSCNSHKTQLRRVNMHQSSAWSRVGKGFGAWKTPAFMTTVKSMMLVFSIQHRVLSLLQKRNLLDVITEACVTELLFQMLPLHTRSAFELWVLGAHAPIKFYLDCNNFSCSVLAYKSQCFTQWEGATLGFSTYHPLSQVSPTKLVLWTWRAL